MPGFIGFPEILLLGLVVLILFGPKRLPEMGRSLGKGMREFKDSVTGEHKDDQVLRADPLVPPADLTSHLGDEVPSIIRPVEGPIEERVAAARRDVA